jgi:DeoR family glycerol-3-phosphate regulon repressor
MPRPKVEVILAGGMLRRSDGGIVGEAAVDFISQFKVDHAVIGASALDEDGAMLDFDYREVRVAKAIMQNARNVMLVADATKFTRTAPVRIGLLSDVDVFVTDQAPPEPVISYCSDNGVRLEMAKGGPETENTRDAAA